MLRVLAMPLLAASLLVPSIAAAAPAAAPVHLQKGDKLVFLGDSITLLGSRPQGYVTLVKQTLDEKHKDLGIEVFNAGIMGHRVPHLQRRLDRDVLAHKPNVVVIYIGINDVWHSGNGRGTPAPAYEAGLKNLIERIRAAGARVILCTPTVIGELKDGKNRFDPMLDQYSDISHKVAADTGTPLVDLRKVFVATIKEQNKNNADQGVLTDDTVHLNAAGNALVAEKMLEALLPNAP